MLKSACLRLAALLLLGLSAASAQETPPAMLMVDVIGDLKVTTPAEAVAKRAELSQAIWGQATPAAFPVTPLAWSVGAGQSIEPTLGRAPATTQWLASYMDKNVTARSIYVTFPGSTCLFIVHQGHGGGFLDPKPATFPYTPDVWMPAGIKALIQRMASASGPNCDLLLVSMPMQGENRYFTSYVGIDPDGWVHDVLGTRADLKPTVGSSLRYFLDPVIGSLDYILAQRSYDKIGMSGLSGGGWATTVIAALDPRVRFSYAVAGSAPLKFRDPARLPEGDWEQFAPDLMSRADYTDLYLMAGADPGRRAWMLHNTNDACCFKSRHVAAYAREITSHARRNGFAPVRFYSSTANTHDVQADMVNLIVSDFMTGQPPAFSYVVHN